MPTVRMTVNGRAVSGDVEGRTLLVQFLRDQLRLTGTHVGCDTSQCGACVVHVDGVSVKLTPREFALLRELAGNPGVAFSRTKLLQKVWGFDYAGDERTVDVHIRRLRAAIEEPWNLHGTLITVHGYGYKFARG